MDIDFKVPNIIDPKESLDRSIKAKQAWQKYRRNYKDGIHRRARIDRLTNNREDVFDFKEQTKRDYSISSVDEDVYSDITVSLRDIEDNHIQGSVYHDNTFLGTFTLIQEELPDGMYLLIDYMKKRDWVPHGFAEAVVSYLKHNFSSVFNGILLHPMNEKLRNLYRALGFKYYINVDNETDYWRLVW